jgi:ABC-type transport system involved in cytochrome c biogenesis permease subunit
MSWLLTVHDLSSALVAALCWWLSHASAIRRDRSGTLTAFGYAVLASAVAVTAVGRSAPANAALLDGLLIAGNLALALALAVVAMRGEPVEKR